MKPLEIEGDVIYIGPVEARGSKGFKVRIVALKVGDKYPQEIPFELTGDATESPPKTGKALFKFYPQGRCWNGKWFASNRLVDFDQEASQPAATESNPAQPAAPSTAAQDGDNLPF